MYFLDLPLIQNRTRKVSRFFLAFFWIAGILSGVWIFRRTGAILVSVMRRAALSPVSIVGLLTASCLPFLLSALAVFLSCPAFLLPITFADGLLLGLAASAVLGAFGSAGWLMCFFISFSAFFTAPLTFFYRLRYVSGERRGSLPEFLLMAGLHVLIGYIDLSFVSPFLASLLF